MLSYYNIGVLGLHLKLVHFITDPFQDQSDPLNKDHHSFQEPPETTQLNIPLKRALHQDPVARPNPEPPKNLGPPNIPQLEPPKNGYIH